MAEPLRVYLEFEPSGEPIAGTVTAGQDQRPFTGWLGLIARLENAIGAWDRRDAASTEEQRASER